MRAAIEAGLEAPTRLYSGTDPLAFVLSLNIHRRHLSATQKAFLALKIEEVEAIEAAKRQLASLKQNATVPEKIPERVGRGEARDKAANAVGASHGYVSDAKRLAREAPDVAEAARAGKLSMSDA